MKKSLNTPFIVCLLLIASTIVSCSSDNTEREVAPRTNTNGKPSQINAEDSNRYYFYNGNQLKKTTNEYSETHYKYNNEELLEVNTFVTDDRIADGESYMTYTREANTITGVGFAAPVSLKVSIELNEKELPIKIITNYGEEEEGLSEKIYSYDSSDRLIKKEYFIEKKLVTAETFEYDNSPGSISKNGLPLWYNIYRDKLNYINNLSKSIEEDIEMGTTYIKNYTYEYNKDGYPITSTMKRNGDEYTYTYTTVY